jgi:hypothetical protein
MNNDNFLSDIESDISGDWKEIQKKLRNKEHEKQIMKNPQRINCPDFMQFYKILLRIMQSWDFDNPDAKLLLDLNELLGMIFAEIEDWPNPLPESFHRVWELFCNPRLYNCDRGVNCSCCQNTWDIFFKEHLREIRYIDQDRFDYTEMTVETSRISCPDCGYPMRNYMGKEVVGIIKSIP